MKTIDTVGVASCIAARDERCALGPQTLRQSPFLEELEASCGLRLEWRPLLKPRGELSHEEAVAELCGRISGTCRALVAQGRPFLLLGGDHSSAMGAWGGAMQGLASPGDLGLIWIDAHMDAHSFSTSPSGNIHGMPLAALLGWGDPRLARIYRDRPVLPARNLVLVGVRSCEREERALLKRLQVGIYTMAEIEQRASLDEVLQEAVERVAGDSGPFGISIDLDAVDPQEAPGVGTPVPGGLSGKALCGALAHFNGDPRLIGVEIAEFNPANDLEQRTERIIAELIAALYGERRNP